MVDASVQTEKLTIDDFMRLYDSEGPFEILDGERVEKVASGYEHGVIQHAMLYAIRDFLKEHNLGKVYMEMAFVLPDSDQRQWVKGSRIPDVMFYSADRLAAYNANITKADKKRPLMIVPDLTIKVVSPTDSYTEVRQKVRAYLRDGVPQVWVIDPDTQSVEVWEKGKEPLELTTDRALTGGDILPGFEIQIAALFEESEVG